RLSPFPSAQRQNNHRKYPHYVPVFPFPPPEALRLPARSFDLPPVHVLFQQLHHTLRYLLRIRVVLRFSLRTPQKARNPRSWTRSLRSSPPVCVHSSTTNVHLAHKEAYFQQRGYTVKTGPVFAARHTVVAGSKDTCRSSAIDLLLLPAKVG